MILDRYIARSVITGTLGALLVVAALFIFVDFARQMEHIGTKNFDLVKAIYYVLLSLPQRLYELAPSLILLGGLISLGSMASNSELVVMRSSGITVARIVRSVLQAGLVLAVLVALAGELLVPYTTNEAKALLAKAMDDRVLAGGNHGVWARDGNRYFNVRNVMPNMQLSDISVYEMDNNRQLTKVTHANRAYLDGDHWVLEGVVHSNISSDGVTRMESTRENWPVLLRVELFDVLRLDPANMSALDLLKYGDYLNQNELDSVPYHLAFWVKVFTPMTCVVMLLIAMPLVLGASPRSGGTGQRVLIGLLLGISFYVLNNAANHLGVVYGLPPVLSASIPLMLVTVVTIVMMRRIR